MKCDQLSDIQAFYDDDLDDIQKLAMQTHVAQCSQCAAALGELRGLSALLAGANRAELPSRLSSRLYGTWQVAKTRGTMRIATWLTGAAAAVFLAALVVLPAPKESPTVVVKSGQWETLAVTPPAEPQTEPGSDLVELAQWIADDLSLNERR